MLINLSKDEIDALFPCLLVASEGLDEENEEDKVLLAIVHSIEEKLRHAIVKDTLKRK